MIECTQCKKNLDLNKLDEGGMIRCHSCGEFIHVEAFPALFRELTSGEVGENLLIDDDAGCFYHPRKKAVIPCSSCGRFLCTLCDVEFNGKHVCLSCLETGKTKKKIKNLENHRTLYDNIALSLSIISLLLWFVTIITAPIVIYIAIRNWKSPGSIIPRTKIRYIAAIIIACLQITGWSALFYNMIAKS